MHVTNYLKLLCKFIIAISVVDIGEVNMDYFITPRQRLPLIQALAQSWKMLPMGSVEGSRSFLFALGSSLLLPSPVNFSTIHELGAGKREGERATLSSVDLLHWSCPHTHTYSQTSSHPPTHTHTHGYACPEKCFHMHAHTHSHTYSVICSTYPSCPWLRPSNEACSRAPLHFR